MKFFLLPLCSLFSLGAMAQSFTINDTVAAGDAQLFFTADSAAATLDGITGTGVTWDYSNLMMYDNTTNLDTVKYASDSPNYADYPLADYHDDIAQGTSNYFTNFLDSVISYGYRFIVDGSEAKIMYDIDPLKMVNIPMVQSDTYADSVKGTAEVFGNSATILGEVVVIADGSGTLELGDSTFSNVLRIKLTEILDATIDLGTFGTASGTVNRTVYTYYDFANGNMPIFVHATIDVNSNLFNGSFKAVYSSVELEIFGSGVNENQIGEMSVYPNPAQDIVNITLPNNIDQLLVLNTLGQTIQTIQQPKSTETINISAFEKGVYLIQIQKGDAIQTQKLIIK
ncbi:MAG: T9SS type A sorting domain-containing protein [Crocinitomicaceae bacterium]